MALLSSSSTSYEVRKQNEAVCRHLPMRMKVQRKKHLHMKDRASGLLISVAVMRSREACRGLTELT